MKAYKIILVFIAFASCYKKPHIEKKWYKVPLISEDIINEIERKNESINTIVASGNGTFNGNLFRGDFDFELYFEKPSKLAMTIKGPLGMELARLWFNRDSLSVYIPGEKSLYYYSDACSLVKIYDFPEINKIIFLSMGIVPIEKNKPYTYIFSDDDKMLKAILTNEQGLELLNLERKDTWNVISYQFFSPDTQPIADFSFDNFKSWDQKILPCSVLITDFKGGDWVKLSYRKIRVNKKIKQDIWAIKVPDDVKIRKLYR